jgi:hypothetical protein
MSIAEKREIALKEIFYFYSRQHTFVGHKSTFDSIKDKFDHLNLSEFMKFCNEFRILVNKNRKIEIFKKTANLSKEMNFEEFKVGLQKISFAINDEKIDFLKKSLNEEKSKLKVIIQKLKKDGIEVDIKNSNYNINNENKEKNEKINENEKNEMNTGNGKNKKENTKNTSIMGYDKFIELKKKIFYIFENNSSNKEKEKIKNLLKQNSNYVNNKNVNGNFKGQKNYQLP